MNGLNTANARIAVASGKGGTGKTTVAVALAQSLGQPVRLLDCDVEEPNCHIFLNPTVEKTQVVSIPVPEVDRDTCTGCGECSAFCQFNAIAMMAGRPLVFPELCHGCGGCMKVCPPGAIFELDRRIGVVESGAAGAVTLVQGRLDVGQPMSPPLIRAVKEHARRDQPVILDCPPGTACPVVASVRDTDYVVLVTEPTPFGLHDLRLAVEMVRALGIPFGVVVNRAGSGDERTAEYCRAEDIEVLMQIPDDRRVAEAYSRGGTLLDALPILRRDFAAVYDSIMATVTAGAGV